MKRTRARTAACCLPAVLLLCADVAAGVTAEALRQRLANGEAITLIDVRPTSAYQRGHIPGAINVPANLVPMKRLPPLGTVVAYDAGLGGRTVDAAVEALNGKPGITADKLAGGYAQWEAVRGLTTAKPGLSRAGPTYTTYQALRELDPADAVLVDLRTPRPQSRQGVGEPGAAPLARLDDHFPGFRSTSDPLRLPGSRQGEEDSATQPLLVLIDELDGRAEQTARMLRANGYRRVLILAGGERIIERGGAPGKKRLGPQRGLETDGNQE